VTDLRSVDLPVTAGAMVLPRVRVSAEHRKLLVVPTQYASKSDIFNWNVHGFEVVIGIHETNTH
jgi:hypothetical protein